MPELGSLWQHLAHGLLIVPWPAPTVPLDHRDLRPLLPEEKLSPTGGKTRPAPPRDNFIASAPQHSNIRWRPVNTRQHRGYTLYHPPRALHGALLPALNFEYNDRRKKTIPKTSEVQTKYPKASCYICNVVPKCIDTPRKAGLENKL